MRRRNSFPPSIVKFGVPAKSEILWGEEAQGSERSFRRRRRFCGACGIGIEKYSDIKEGDVIEAFVMEQIEV